MSDHVLARRYRAVMLAYPRTFRASRGEELLGTLLDCAGPQQQWPSAREVVSVVVEGLRVRLHAAGRRPARVAWRDGGQIAVLLLLACALAQTVADLSAPYVPMAAGVVVMGSVLASMLLVLRGRWLGGIVLAAAGLAVQLRFLVVSWYLVAALAGIVLLAAALRSQARPVRSIAWLLAVPVALALFAGPGLLAGGPVYLHPYIQAAAVTTVAVGLLGALFDARMPIVAAGLVAAEVLRLTVMGPSRGDSDDSGVIVSVADQVLSATVAVPQKYSGVYVFIDLTWWTLVLGVAAAMLLLAGHLTVRARTRL